jgi:NAD(P)-dependent dehydrogenase (short-subunit alcohol dehydrogenase family)
VDRLSGKLALVTGAGAGIGQAIALELAKEGAAVVLHFAHSGDGAQEAAKQIIDKGGRATALGADLRDVGECRRVVDSAAQFLGGLDILVNCVGVTATVDFLDTTEETYNDLFAINMRSHFFCAQQATLHMLSRGGGSILNISSLHAFAGMPGHSVYAATKGAGISLTRELAIELAPKRIRVNALAPGSIEVPRKLATPEYDGEIAGSWVPWGRVGFPVDIARAAAFLVSDDAEYITGQVMRVDGGIGARMALYVDHK